MRKFVLLIIVLVCFCLSACGGGGGSSGGESNPVTPPAQVTMLSPLKIDVMDLNNNPIPYIDISKIGSHIIYKLQFTNTNTVNVYLGGFAAYSGEAYAAAQAQNMGISTESYEDNYQAGGVQYSVAIKTTNADDCFNHMESFSDGVSHVLLQPGEACSYYTKAVNIGNNYSSNDTFTVPVSYIIYNDDLNLHLNVVQCKQNGYAPNPITYDCSNMSKPGFADQFITYKMLPINGTSNVLTFNPYGTTISPNGSFLWNCTSSTCTQYALTYDSIANTLTQTMTPLSTTGINNGGRYVELLYSSFDGSNVWVSSYTNRGGFSLVNTSNPWMLFTGDCSSNHCVPNMDSTLNLGSPPGFIGLDGSFWWNTGASADIYNPTAQTFVSTNIGRVIGVNADGTIIGYSGGDLGCWTAGANYASYNYRGSLQNYVNPNLPTSVDTYSYGQNVYMIMYVKGLYTYDNNGYAAKAYYKVHTENGQCQINLDDYTYFIEDISQYVLAGTGDHLGTPFLVTSSANVYSGL